MAIRPGAFIEADDISGFKEFITDDLYDSAGQTIATGSEAIEATLSIVIPSTWGSYDLRAKTNGRILSATARTVTHQVRKTNVSGTSGGISSTTCGAAPGNNPAFVCNGKWEGETATGTVTVVLTMVSTVDALATWDDIFMELWAFRLT